MKNLLKNARKNTRKKGNKLFHVINTNDMSSENTTEIAKTIVEFKYAIIARGENDQLILMKTTPLRPPDFTCVICLSNDNEESEECSELEWNHNRGEQAYTPVCRYTSIVSNTIGSEEAPMCTHVFHTSCIYKWFDQQKRILCPLCMSEIQIEELYPLYLPGPELKMTRWNNGNVKEKYYEIDNKKIGDYESFTETGHLMTSCKYNKYGLKDGIEKEYYPLSKKIRSHVTWINGQKHGPFWIKNCNGWWMSKGAYKNGKLDGHFRKWHHNTRSIYVACKFRNGVKNGTYLEYHNNGQLYRFLRYIDNKPIGKLLEFYSNGVLKRQAYLDESQLFDGIFIEKYSSGQLKTKKYYHHGNPIYTNEKWHNNGTRSSYQERILFPPPPRSEEEEDIIRIWIKNGIWKKWNRDGVITSWIPYENGELHGTGARFDDKGDPIEGAEYIKGVLNGKWCSYYPLDRVHWVCHFENGKLNGETTQYSRDGHKILTLNYKNNQLHGTCVDYIENQTYMYENGELKNEA